MGTLAEAAAEFLAHKRIAVAGVSRHAEGHGANLVYRRLRDRGYQTFAVNPAADTVEGDACFRDLKSIPGGVDGVVIATPPEAAEAVARECRELGITRVWMHQSGGTRGTGSVSAEAVSFCRENGISTIAGACPLMFGPTSDFGHVCIRWFLGVTGRLPAPPERTEATHRTVTLV